ncbi:MAG: DUF488 domain-containing protein [Luteimonas sp.]
MTFPDVDRTRPTGDALHDHGAGTAAARETLWTIGHSTRPWDAFLALLQEADIEMLVDVRRYAGSRRNPQFSPATMAPALGQAGIHFQPMPEFGGRRRPGHHSPNTAWRVPAFRAYADYMATPDYVHARDRLAQVARDQRTAVMCAEAVWWRCHRRLIADDFIARGWQVLHLMAPGRSNGHPLHEAARMIDGVLRYPAQSDAQARLF